MDGSLLLGWIAVVFGALALGTLLRAYVRPERDDPRSTILIKAGTALAAAVTLGPLPRLFGLENEVLRWSVTALSGALTIFAWVQLLRLRRVK